MGISTLPNYENAVIPIEKLTHYALNVAHPVGKHKAKLFNSVFGWTDADALFVAQIILAALSNNDAELTKQNEYGDFYTVSFLYSNNIGTANILTAWIVQDDIPRLITCYIF